jgi:hypothetical protein
MKKGTLTLISAAVVIMASAGMALSPSGTVANAYQTVSSPEPQPEPLDGRYSGFDIQVLVNGSPLEEYAARGRHYVEAQDGAEYELRVSNPLGIRVAVALSVDGLNTIDARRSSGWEASKWVIEPYQSITISGWQMSSSRARRFYFTTERDSYGAKLGETANLGVISAVFFRENRPVVVVPRPRRPRDYDDERIESEKDGRRSEAPSSGRDSAGQAKTAEAAPRANDDYAATGIGRNVEHDVQWVNLDLQSRPAGEVTIRYEYRAALVRLGITPRRYPSPDPLRRRERSTGFEGRGFSPEP